jgi:hypothetical protein
LTAFKRAHHFKKKVTAQVDQPIEEAGRPDVLFWKKEPKLLSVSDGTEFASVNSVPAEMDEKFFASFFQKRRPLLHLFRFRLPGQLRKRSKSFIC